MPTPQCDFCTVQHTTREYPAHTFTITERPKPGTVIHATSIENWHACDECAALIDANNGSALAERAVNLILEKHKLMFTNSMPRETLLPMVAKFHAAFYANRIGDTT